MLVVLLIFSLALYDGLLETMHYHCLDIYVLGNDYEDICEYFPNCAFAADGRCRKNDLLFSFIGRVGVVTGNL